MKKHEQSPFFKMSSSCLVDFCSHDGYWFGISDKYLRGSSSSNWDQWEQLVYDQHFAISTSVYLFNMFIWWLLLKSSHLDFTSDSMSSPSD